MNTLTINLAEDKEIIEGFTSGKVEQASTVFVRKYKNFVYSTALRYMKNHDDAEDVAQESFIKAIKHLPTFRSESTLKTWLYRITVNQSISMLRKKSLRNVFSVFSKDEDERTVFLPDNNPTPDKQMEVKELENTLLNALLELPEKQRETFSLRYFDELPYEEISSMLGTSVGGLKANYYHAVKKLAAIIGQEK